jgi:hypothetical protein
VWISAREVLYVSRRSISSAGTCRQLQTVLPSPLHMRPAVCSCAGELCTDAGGSSDTAQGNSSTVLDMMLHALPPLGGATAAAPVKWIAMRRKANIVRCASQLLHANTVGVFCALKCHIHTTLAECRVEHSLLSCTM